MSRSGRLFLQDMLECARKVVRYTAHLTREQFFSSELEYDATLRNLEILGEAAKKVPDELKRLVPVRRLARDRGLSGCPRARIFCAR
jgi:uncharacterized protein with HEPN domain